MVPSEHSSHSEQGHASTSLHIQSHSMFLKHKQNGRFFRILPLPFPQEQKVKTRGRATNQVLQCIQKSVLSAPDTRESWREQEPGCRFQGQVVSRSWQEAEHGHHRAPQRLPTAMPMSDDLREPRVRPERRRWGLGSFSLTISFVLPQVQPKGMQRQGCTRAPHAFPEAMPNSILVRAVGTAPKHANVSAEVGDR